jgi:Leucine-rich repeat (LRR) protein
MADRGQALAKVPLIPADVAQIVAEYSDAVATLLKIRGVSARWRDAACDAVGFLNSRCWTTLVYDEAEERTSPLHPLENHFREDYTEVILRGATLLLRSRLETLVWRQQRDASRARLSLRLLGNNNTTLRSLRLSGIAVADSAVLETFTALSEVAVSNIDQDDVRHIARIPNLERAAVSASKVTDLTPFSACPSLIELRAAYCDVNDDTAFGGAHAKSLQVLELVGCRSATSVGSLRGHGTLRELSLVNASVVDVTLLSSIPTLEKIVLFRCRQVMNLSVLAACANLRVIHAAATGVSDTGLETVADIATLTELDLSHTQITNAGIASLARISSLQTLLLNSCSRVSDVNLLKSCHSLRTLRADHTSITSAGITGLGDIDTLETVSLRGCGVDTAEGLPRALQELNLSSTKLRTIPDLDCAASLLKLELRNCNRLSCATMLQCCVALQELDLSATVAPISDSVIVAIGHITTLQKLDLWRCANVSDVRPLRGCRALRILRAAATSVTAAGIAGLECLPDLVELNFASCDKLADVRSLASCSSLRELHLSRSAVTDAGIAGLERIPTLEVLSLACCNDIAELPLLQHASRLRDLQLSCTDVTDACLPKLARITSLQRLDLDSCAGVTNVDALRCCRGLQDLNVNRTAVRFIPPELRRATQSSENADTDP